VRAAGQFEEVGEGLELGGGEVGELAVVFAADGVVEFGEPGEAGGGDVAEVDAAVVGAAFAFGEFEYCEAFEEAGDVGDAGDHAAADFEDRYSGGVFTAEDAEDVVGGLREAVGFEEFDEGFGEEMGSWAGESMGLGLRMRVARPGVGSGAGGTILGTVGRYGCGNK
jgi:hypothetical protein